MPPKAIIQQDLSKGSNIVTNPYDQGQQQSLRLLNLLLDEHGSARTRPGTHILTTAPQPGRRIVRVFDFVKSDGSVIKVAILRGNVALGAPVNELYIRTDDPTIPWTFVFAFFTIEDIPDCAIFNNLLMICNGYELLEAWDGTVRNAIASPPGPPGCKHIAVHLGSLWAWNTNPVTTLTAGPSSLQASGVNDPTSWNIADQVFIAKDDGQSG